MAISTLEDVKRERRMRTRCKYYLELKNVEYSNNEQDKLKGDFVEREQTIAFIACHYLTPF